MRQICEDLPLTKCLQIVVYIHVFTLLLYCCYYYQCSVFRCFDILLQIIHSKACLFYRIYEDDTIPKQARDFLTKPYKRFVIAAFFKFGKYTTKHLRCDCCWVPVYMDNVLFLSYYESVLIQECYSSEC